MVVRRTSLLVAAVGTAIVATVGGSVALAQQSADEPAGTDDAALLTRLDELEADLPAEVAPVGVTIDDEGEGATTWGSLDGDLTGASATIETVQPELLRLYVDADDARTPVATAVADVARGWLDLGEGYTRLATWEAHDLAFPLDAADDEGTATDADELRGSAETGLRLVLGARQRHLAGYTALRELGAAEPDVQTRLDDRAADAEAFDRDIRPLVVRLLSEATTQVLVPVERFETDAPGVDARARSFSVTCVERSELATAGDEAVVPDAADPVAPQAPTRTDCPDLASELRVEGP